MAQRPLILVLAAGAALTVAGCGGTHKTTDEPGMTSNPPPPEPPPTPEPPGNPPPPTLETPVAPPTAQRPPDPMPPTANPPMPDGRARLALISPSLPAFDDVASPHPEGATNPPSPVLIVHPDGRCFKRWEGGMVPPGGDRVETVKADAQTTAINCPLERAQGVWDAWAAAGKPDPTIPGWPPGQRKP